MGNAYDAWHEALGRQEGDAGNESAMGIWYEMVRPRLGPLEGLKVIEVGCGRGAFAIELARQGAVVTALDFSRTAVQIGRNRAAREGVTVNFIEADAQNTNLPSKEFDLVISCECMEHVPNPDAMAFELFRILKPGGRCLLTTPSYFNGTLLAWAMDWIRKRPHNSGAGIQPHENFFLYFLVRRTLKKAGFRIKSYESRMFQWLLLPRTDPARLRTVRFKSGTMNLLARPFGLHFLYEMARPSDSHL